MENSQIIDKTAEYVRRKLEGESSGHDWWHVYRVWEVAKTIAEKENADNFVVELAALLHDISDWKFNDGDDTVGPRIAGEWLQSLDIDNKTIKTVQEAIEDISFKGAGVVKEVRSREGKIVQDADRLDAIGAIGIGRTFAYGGYKGREMYNPDVKVKMANNFEEYKSAGMTTINHFYEKLLLLKDLMNTKTAQKMAENRHKVMERFLDEFYLEWDGKV